MSKPQLYLIINGSESVFSPRALPQFFTDSQIEALKELAEGNRVFLFPQCVELTEGHYENNENGERISFGPNPGDSEHA